MALSLISINYNLMRTANASVKYLALSSLCLEKILTSDLTSDSHDFLNTIEPSNTTMVTSITIGMAPSALSVEQRTRFCFYSKLRSFEVSKRGRVFPNVELDP